MKLLVVSDLHNNIFYTKKIIEIFKSDTFFKLLILGDIGIESIKLLNPFANKILAVRGNNDGYNNEDSISKFDLPLINHIIFNNLRIYFTHGHIYNENNFPASYDVLLLGHYHISYIYKKGHSFVANPGSISLPRDNYHSYMIIDNEGIKIYDINTRKLVNCVCLNKED